MVALSRFRHRDPAFSDLLPYAAMVDDGVMLLKDGSLVAGWYFAGADCEGATAQERNDISRQANAVLAQLGTGWMIQIEAVRVPATPYPAPEASYFPDTVSRAIDEEQRKRFEASESAFESQHAIILTYKEQQKSKRTKYVFAEPGWMERPADIALANFKASIAQFEQSMANIVSLRRMRAQDGESVNGRPVKFDDLLQFVRLCLIGESHPVRLPDVPMYLDHVVSAEFHHGLSPVIDDRFVNVVAIDGFPAESWPGILNALDRISLSYRWSTRFIFVDPNDAQARLMGTRRKWLRRVRPFMDLIFKTNSGAIDQDAPATTGEAENAITQADPQPVAFGSYTPVIVLFDTNATRGREKAELVRRLIQNEGFGARIENLNITDAFLGSLPGNWYCNVREPMINTANLADLIPLNSVWAGERECPCPLYPPHSPPLMQVASESTPFRLNLHSGDLGHTLVVGPPGSGKSTLLALVAAQFRRYPESQVFCFDKGLAMSPITVAVGGTHYNVDEDTALAFCPLSELDTDADQAWAAEWLEILIEMQGVSVTPDHRDAIAAQIKLLSAQGRRSLSSFVEGVRREDIKDALDYYTTGGPMGHLMDAEEDKLTFTNFMCFEIEKLMNMGDRDLMPVLYYLFRRIEKCLTGAPSLIILDEAWLMLGHEIFQEWLKVLRKANCAVVLATQSISNAAQPGIMNVLKELCPTRIYLANGEAADPETHASYQSLGLNERQIEIIISAVPKRDYYVVSPIGRRLFHMTLDPLMLSFAGACCEDDLKRVNELYQEHGENWSAVWLEERAQFANEQSGVGRSRTRRSTRGGTRKRSSRRPAETMASEQVGDQQPEVTGK